MSKWFVKFFFNVLVKKFANCFVDTLFKRAQAVLNAIFVLVCNTHL